MVQVQHVTPPLEQIALGAQLLQVHVMVKESQRHRGLIVLDEQLQVEL